METVGDYSEADVFKKNRFEGYLENLRNENKKLGLNVSYVTEVVNVYYRINGLDHQSNSFYRTGRYARTKLSNEAKRLLDECGGSLDDALWCLDKMKYIAEKKRFDWSISTCLKYNLRTA